MGDFVLPLSLVAIVGGIFVAGSGFCNARDVEHEIDALGASVTELETAPLGIQVKLEGLLERGDRSVKSFVEDRECVAAYVRLSTISESEDSDGDTVTHRAVNFEAQTSAEVLRFRRDNRRVAVPNNYWKPRPAAYRSRSSAWPSWAPTKHKRRYRGSFSHYEIDHLCLVAGRTHFVVGIVDRISDAAQPGRGSVELMEVAEPVLWLRPLPAGGPVEVWPGNEGARVASLQSRHAMYRSVTLGGLIAAVVGVVLFVVLIKRR